jgi:glutathione S-transferase
VRRIVYHPQGKDISMKLYYFETLNPRKACAVARYLGSPVEFVRVDLGKGENRRSEFLAINPNGKVPALTHGSTRLWEADAIISYLAKIAGSDLWPAGDDQIELMRWLSWNAHHFTRHAGTLYFQHIIKPRLGMGEADPKAVEEASGFFKQFAQVLNDHLRGRRYLLGDTLTIGDFSVAVTLPYAEKARIPVGGFPEIERWHARLNELPSWREPFPSTTKAAA